MVRPPEQALLNEKQMGEEVQRVLGVGVPGAPTTAVRFSIREHCWQREPPVDQVRAP